MREKRALEKFLGIGCRYVLNFSGRTFSDFVHEAVNIEIQADDYTTHGTSKAKKLRAYWGVKSDYLVERLLNALIEENDQVYCRVRALADHREVTASNDYLYVNFDMKPYPNFRGSIGTEQVSKR